MGRSRSRRIVHQDVTLVAVSILQPFNFTVQHLNITGGEQLDRN